MYLEKIFSFSKSSVLYLASGVTKHCEEGDTDYGCFSDGCPHLGFAGCHFSL